MSLSITPTTPGNDALTGGFTDPVFDAQSVFKMMMDAMARPGTVQTVVCRLSRRLHRSASPPARSP